MVYPLSKVKLILDYSFFKEKLVMSSMVSLIDAPIVAEDAASTSTSFAPVPAALVR